MRPRKTDSQSVIMEKMAPHLLYCIVLSSILSANKVKLRCCMQNKCSYIDRSIHSLSRHNPQGFFFFFFLSFTVICILQYLLYSRHCKNHAAGPSIKKKVIIINEKRSPSEKKKNKSLLGLMPRELRNWGF